MKRFHVHVNVVDLEGSIAFYTHLFGDAPAVVKPDYAKWMLDDPRLNFAISRLGRTPGVDHLGIQAGDATELEAIGARLKSADAIALAETATTCCYAHSDKYWAEDPQRIRWETFHTFGEATTYYAPAKTVVAAAGAEACCGPRSENRKPVAACCGAGVAAAAPDCCN